MQDQNDAQTAESTSEKNVTTNQNSQKRSPSKKTWIIPAVIIIVAVVVGGAIYLYGKSHGNNKVVAKVNGEVITSQDVTDSVNHVKPFLIKQGADFTDPNTVKAIRSQALDSLINENVILQAADKANITVTDDELTTQFQNTKSQFDTEEAFQQQLQSADLTEDELREEIKDQAIIQNYFDQTVATSSITVSDEEVQQAYDTFKAQSGTSTPAFADIKDAIQSQLLQQKISVAQEKIMASLRADATIENYEATDGDSTASTTLSA